MRDFHKNISVVNAITPQAVGTTGSGGGKTSAFIDRRGYESVEFVCQSGASASVADTITTQITESDATGSGFASVAADNLIGSKAARALTTAKAWSVGYRGNKRYLKVQLFGLATATAIVSAAAILARPMVAPVAT
jgi:hypothetical protein